MNSSEYKALAQRLKSREDIKKIARERQYDQELLMVILSQKIVRNTKRSYYEIKRKAPALLGDWIHGKRFVDIAREEGFPPVLTASLMLQHTGMSKKQFKNYVNNPATIEDPRLRKELKDALKDELIYSPEGTRIQHGRGKDVEWMVKKWLDARRLKYLTEYDAKKGNYTKTPDFKLDQPMKVEGRWINWIECKGSFGDEVEYKRDYGKQLSKYAELFGPGMVVYWYGYLDDMPAHLLDDNVLLEDKRFFGK